MSKWADLKVRTISAIVLIVGFLALLFMGTYTFVALLTVAAIILMMEWVRLTKVRSYKWVWFITGFFYITIAIFSLATMRHWSGPYSVLGLVLLVIAIDVGGYFVGKLIGKHKIWPSVSPGKTWEGALGSLIFALCYIYFAEFANTHLFVSAALFTFLAIAGDLFESSLKRRAGVKDSGTLIPGHGGLFDRVDALLPCSILYGLPYITISIAYWLDPAAFQV